MLIQVTKEPPRPTFLAPCAWHLQTSRPSHARRGRAKTRMARAVARLKARPFAKQGANRPEHEVLNATTNTYVSRVRLISVRREDPLLNCCCLARALALRLPLEERLELLALGTRPLGRLWAAGSTSFQHRSATSTVHVRSARPGGECDHRCGAQAALKAMAAHHRYRNEKVRALAVLHWAPQVNGDGETLGG